MKNKIIIKNFQKLENWLLYQKLNYFYDQHEIYYVKLLKFIESNKICF